MREAIRGNQRQSEAIRTRALRSAQRRKANRGNWRQIEAIRGNQRQLEALRGTQRPTVEGAKVPVPSVSAQAQSSRIRRGIQPHAHNWRIEASTRGAPVRPTHLPSGAITRHSEARSEALRGTLLWAVASYGLGPSTAHSSYQAANVSKASTDGLPNMGSCLIWQQPSSGATTGSA